MPRVRQTVLLLLLLAAAAWQFAFGSAPRPGPLPAPERLSMPAAPPGWRIIHDEPLAQVAGCPGRSVVYRAPDGSEAARLRSFAAPSRRRPNPVPRQPAGPRDRGSAAGRAGPAAPRNGAYAARPWLGTVRAPIRGATGRPDRPGSISHQSTAAASATV